MSNAGKITHQNCGYYHVWSDGEKMTFNCPGATLSLTLSDETKENTQIMANHFRLAVKEILEKYYERRQR